MDLDTFRAAVDSCPDEITPKLGSLEALYRYVGLPVGSSLQQQEVSKELYNKIRKSFTAGHPGVWKHARALFNALVQQHVIDGRPLEPYASVLEHIKDAMHAAPRSGDAITGDWNAAILHAYDHLRLKTWDSAVSREGAHARLFEIARAAKRLQDAGFALVRQGDMISLEPASEEKLVAKIEWLVAAIGGINVARQIFASITRFYDTVQERYHVVPHPQMMGGGEALLPLGYLIHLAAKHFVSKSSAHDAAQNWARLMRLATDYAAVFDVQPYVPQIYVTMDTRALLTYLQKLALHDLLFRIPQFRGSDVDKILRGVLRDYDLNKPYGSGWCLNDVLAVVGAMLKLSNTKHGPHWFDVAKLKDALVAMPAKTIQAVLDDVLTHAPPGPNRTFAKPTDAPAKPGDKTGHDFYSKPLMTRDGKTYWLLDRSLAAGPCIEAIFAVLRPLHSGFDDKLGAPIEEFIRGELTAHGVPSLQGHYGPSENKTGECDIVVEATKTVMFLELKKKALTRQAQAGSDAHVLIDLTNSLLDAQVQAGWHEVHLRKGPLALDAHGATTPLELKGRDIERIAVSFLEFGSFQDRILLKQFLEGILHANFSVSDASLQKKFDTLNNLLEELRQQINTLHAGEKELHQPFFHCWFLSVPQILALLDGVNGPDEFRDALWKTRHIVTGSSDFYHDLNYVRRMGEAGTRKGGAVVKNTTERSGTGDQ
jgi:hypothetical protein